VNVVEASGLGAKQGRNSPPRRTENNASKHPCHAARPAASSAAHRRSTPERRAGGRMRGKLSKPDGQREHVGVRGGGRLIGGRVRHVHPLARGAELPRPEGQRTTSADGLGGHPAVARVPVRRARVPAPAAEGTSEPRTPVPTGPRTDAGRVSMHAQARDLGLPRPDHLAPIEPGRQQRGHRQRRVLHCDPEVDRHGLAGVRAGGGRVRAAVSRRNRGAAHPVACCNLVL